MRLKNIVTAAVAVFCNLLSYSARSQQFSYVYIQGDKQTPFYVKLEGQMQARYGKNYSIISQLAPGTVNIEVLFQQNIYPPQHFAIKVPENGSRAFLLSRKGNSFSLYDLQQQFYINAGNNGDDDHIPTYNPGDNYVRTNTPTTNSQETANSNAYHNTYAAANNSTPANTSQNTQQYNNRSNSRQQQNTQPQFIDNVELNNERTVQNNTETVESDNYVAPETDTEREAPVTPAPKPNVPVKNNYSVNGECPQAMGDNVFQDLYEKMNVRSEKTRLKFLLGRLDNCYTTSQVRMLAKGLANDPERYAYLKQAYPRVSDQGNFASLENLLTTREWKDYFRLIMP